MTARLFGSFKVICSRKSDTDYFEQKLYSCEFDLFRNNILNYLFNFSGQEILITRTNSISFAAMKRYDAIKMTYGLYNCHVLFS